MKMMNRQQHNTDTAVLGTLTAMLYVEKCELYNLCIMPAWIRYNIQLGYTKDSILAWVYILQTLLRPVCRIDELT